MLIERYEITPLNAVQCLLSWESETDDAVSWIFLNGKFYLGPFFAETKKRSMGIPFAARKTLAVEIHDFDDIETVPASVEEMPLTRPIIGWNAIAEASRYRLYHEQRRLTDYPNIPLPRIEVDCPITLEGRGGRWHRFNVETLDRFGRETLSGGEVITYFAADLPNAPEVNITHNPATGHLTFTIGE
jgi:hypothetical protein